MDGMVNFNSNRVLFRFEGKPNLLPIFSRNDYSAKGETPTAGWMEDIQKGHHRWKKD
jgi:hypothetical protein